MFQDEDNLEKMPSEFMEKDAYVEKMRRISAQLRIHPTRNFFPGQTYHPEVGCDCLQPLFLYHVAYIP